MDYRNIYADYFGVKIPDGFIIHHIDENRDNNEIPNLLMMPDALHRKWHSIKKECKRSQMMESLDYMFGIDNISFPIAASIIEEYIKIRWEVQDWINEKHRMAYQAYLRVVK